MGAIADKLRDLQKTYKENNYAEYDQILDFAIEIAETEENKCCEWKIVDTPHGMPIYNTGCGKIRLSCATGKLLPDGEKPDWCPLRELPEKIPDLKSGYEDISTSIRRVGWNACLDEILEERKE